MDLVKIFGVKAGIALFLVVVITIFVFGPLCVAWALNYLFNLNLAYSFDTWVAITVIHMFFHTTIKSK